MGKNSIQTQEVAASSAATLLKKARSKAVKKTAASALVNAKNDTKSKKKK